MKTTTCRIVLAIIMAVASSQASALNIDKNTWFSYAPVDNGNIIFLSRKPCHDKKYSNQWQRASFRSLNRSSQFFGEGCWRFHEHNKDAIRICAYAVVEEGSPTHLDTENKCLFPMAASLFMDTANFPTTPPRTFTKEPLMTEGPPMTKPRSIWLYSYNHKCEKLGHETMKEAINTYQELYGKDMKIQSPLSTGKDGTQYFVASFRDNLGKEHPLALTTSREVCDKMAKLHEATQQDRGIWRYNGTQCDRLEIETMEDAIDTFKSLYGDDMQTESPLSTGKDGNQYFVASVKENSGKERPFALTTSLEGCKKMVKVRDTAKQQ